MKYKNKILKIMLFSLVLTACDEQIMEWEKDPAHGDITEAEIPLSDNEKLKRYEALNTYTNMKLGTGIGLDLYLENEVYRKLTNENFDEVTVGYAMKHGPMVNSKGEINYTKADSFVNMVKNAGLSVFGHTLVWHSNQNALYLKGLIVPTIVPDTTVAAGDNLLSNERLNASLDGWFLNNGKAEALTHNTVSNTWEGNGSMKVINETDHPGEQWQTQVQTTLADSLEPAATYTLSFMIKSDATGSIRCSTVGDDQYQGDQTTSTTWSLITWEFVATGNETGISLDLGLLAGNYYIDYIILAERTEVSIVTTTSEKSNEEKAVLIGDAMESFINGMVSHYKNDIKAWDVVNEPMNENGTVRTGDVAEAADDHFYWMKYLGKDYAVTAFKLARQYGNEDDILFINDYNLESSLDKCDGIIDYVSYIEGKGAEVDGIGTQMHISITSDSAKIEQMFQKLAASGKLIKISELDVRLGTKDPSPEQLEAQAQMYQFVVDMYMKYIPEAQRYGITIWGISDNEEEHEFWLPEESPNLWDAAYERKPAYMGVANGLAGKDVSIDFTGELEF